MPFPVVAVRRATSPGVSRRPHSPGRPAPSTGSYSYTSQEEPSSATQSRTLNEMTRIEKRDAFADFKKFYQEKHKYSEDSALKHANDDRIREAFEKFYADNDRDIHRHPDDYAERMADYKLYLGRANTNCMGDGCVVSGGKSRKSRKHRKHRKSRKSRKHRKSRKY